MQSCRPEKETFTENHFNFVPFLPPSQAPQILDVLAEPKRVYRARRFIVVVIK